MDEIPGVLHHWIFLRVSYLRKCACCYPNIQHFRRQLHLSAKQIWWKAAQPCYQTDNNFTVSERRFYFRKFLRFLCRTLYTKPSLCHFKLWQHEKNTREGCSKLSFYTHARCAFHSEISQCYWHIILLARTREKLCECRQTSRISAFKLSVSSMITARHTNSVNQKFFQVFSITCQACRTYGRAYKIIQAFSLKSWRGQTTWKVLGINETMTTEIILKYTRVWTAYMWLMVDTRGRLLETYNKIWSP